MRIGKIQSGANRQSHSQIPTSCHRNKLTPNKLTPGSYSLLRDGEEDAELGWDETAIRHLEHCLDQLPSRSREAVELRYQQAHRPPEIARRMGWTVESVHVALSRARAVLKECVQRRLSAGGA